MKPKVYGDYFKKLKCFWKSLKLLELIIKGIICG